jgi:heme/copper-type cytochrome/quinol oxidase subunit 2
MKKIFFAVLFIFIIFIVGCATGSKMKAVEGMPSGAPVETVQLKGNNCIWTPDLIKVKKGTHVMLEVESADFDYNFRLNGYGLRFMVPKGKKVTAEFYASEKGEFEFGCYIEKGLHYSWGGMVGKLIVE